MRPLLSSMNPHKGGAVVVNRGAPIDDDGITDALLGHDH